ncbi:hypothetical protein HK097_005692 [Rhizophlyctis rosea]|uniref:Ankyrin n=1 Tax=Rhizophlyctis rosea TaxID=64517 RepID=A0AAD5X336_9FUNG|nr:hypothetical protein HK097_005692 [Rhizophlyctis rosea]
MLPPEIARLIAYFSDPKSSRNLRAANKAFAATITTKDLFKSEALWRWGHHSLLNSWSWLAQSGFTDIARPFLPLVTDIERDLFLIISAAWGQLDNCVWMLEIGVTTSITNAFMNAVRHGHHLVVGRLLEAGANVNGGQWSNVRQKPTIWNLHRGDGRSLLVAAEAGHADVLKVLIARGADVGSDGMAAVSALESDNLEAFRILYDAGANIENALQHACVRGHVRIATFLLDTGAYTQNDRRHPFRFAVWHGRTEVVKMMIPRLEKISVHGILPLWDAVSNGHMEVVSLLLEAGVSESEYCFNPITAAARRRRLDIVKLFLSLKRKPSQILLDYAFLNAAEARCLDIMKLLREAGANVNFQNGETLRLAAATEQHEIVSWLLSHGATPVDDKLVKALDVACYEGDDGGYQIA